MIRFLVGFATGAAAMLGLLIIEEYLANASLQDEGTNVITWPSEMAATT